MRDDKAIKNSITSTGEFRVHLIHSRSGLRTVARMWHHDGYVVGTANGGGYDKAGAALGQAIELFFAEELKGLQAGYEMRRIPDGPFAGQATGGKCPSGLYGLTKRANGSMDLDGSCGLECMLKVLIALGFTDATRYATGKLSSLVVARKPKQSPS